VMIEVYIDKKVRQDPERFPVQKITAIKRDLNRILGCVNSSLNVRAIIELLENKEFFNMIEKLIDPSIGVGVVENTYRSLGAIRSLIRTEISCNLLNNTELLKCCKSFVSHLTGERSKVSLAVSLIPASQYNQSILSIFLASVYYLSMAVFMAKISLIKIKNSCLSREFFRRPQPLLDPIESHLMSSSTDLHSVINARGSFIDDATQESIQQGPIVLFPPRLRLIEDISDSSVAQPTEVVPGRIINQTTHAFSI